jgi:hypothetical protein
VPFLKDISYRQMQENGVELGDISVFAEVNDE